VKWGRAVVVVLALAASTIAVVWVSAVRFKDYASAYDCGVPVGASWHGRHVDALFLDAPPLLSGQTSAVVGVPLTEAGTTATVCAGEARRRVGIAAVVVAMSLGAVVLALRRRPRPDGQIAPAT
jgi:hypothetical protein